MAKFKFYLENRKEKSGLLRELDVPIIYSFSFNGYRLKSTVGERIDRKHWSEKTQRVKGGKNRVQINQRLDAFQAKVEKIFRESTIMEEKLTPSIFFDKLKTEKKSTKTLKEYFEEFLELTKQTCTEGTYRKNKSAGKQLEIYLAKKRKNYTFEDFTPDALQEISNYFIKDCELTNNTIAQRIKIIKRFLNWGLEKGYHDNDKFKRFTLSEKEGEIIVLDWDELMHLYNLAIKQNYLAQVRDVFCFGCFTSLRYSDIHNLKRSNVVNDTIRITVIKTKEVLEIPLNDYSKAILKKYDHLEGEYCLPVISNQKMNTYLKDVGKVAKFDTPISIVRFNGTRRVEKTEPKHQFLTSHVARKTFITNAFRMGIPVEIIMKISGHKDHRVFKRYNKIAQDQVKTAMLKFNQNPNDITGTENNN